MERRAPYACLAAALLAVVPPAFGQAKAGLKPEKDHEHVFSAEEERAARMFPQVFGGVTVTIENLGPAYGIREIPPPLGEPGMPDELVVIDQIINIGKKVWQIIKDNEPVVNVTKDYATAVPEGIKRWDQLAGWRTPEGTVYGFKAVNGFGSTMIYVKYQVIRTFGGSYRDAKGVRRGKYLTGVTVEPLHVEVGWGYRFDMEAKVPTVVNAGESSDDPLAAMLVNLEWKIATPIKKSQATAVYYVRGDGMFREVGGPFKQDFKDKAPVAAKVLGGLPDVAPILTPVPR